MRSSTRSKRCMTPGRRERILENQRRRIPAAAGIIPGGKDMTTRGMIGGEHRCLRSGGTDCRFLRPAGGFLCFNCCSQNGWERRHPAGGAASQFLPLRPSICLSFHISLSFYAICCLTVVMDFSFRDSCQGFFPVSLQFPKFGSLAVATNLHIPSLSSSIQLN